MKTVSKRRAIRKLQKQARKTQRQIKKRKKNHSFGKRLTPEQKKRRSQQLIERKEFKQKVKNLNKEKEATEKIKSVHNKLFSIFNLENLDQLARKTGFIRRKGEITAFAFVYIISFGFFGNGGIALSYLVAGLSLHFKIIVSPQALSKRINSNNSPKFLRAVLQHLLGVQMKMGLRNSSSIVFPMFNGIYLQDSSQVELNEELAEDFKGFGGAASASALKLDFIYEITNFIVCGLKITSSTINDQTNTKEILKYIKSNSLVIRDLGYFTVDILKSIEKKKAYYLSRLSISTNAYLSKDCHEPLDIPAYLQKLQAEGKDISNIKIYVGKKERLETRLVAAKVPLHVTVQRATKFKRERKKEPTVSYLAWCGFSIFITNIPRTIFSGKMIIEIYKIRWQIELVFKNLKSNIEISVLKGTNKNRVYSLVYGKIITLVMTFIIQNYATHIAADKEVSGDKLTKLLLSDNRLQKAIIQNDMSMLLIDLGYSITLVCKQKRTRKTTYEGIKEALEREWSEKNKIVSLEVLVEVNLMQETVSEYNVDVFIEKKLG